jgi:hypothetical protein
MNMTDNPPPVAAAIVIVANIVFWLGVISVAMYY